MKHEHAEEALRLLGYSAHTGTPRIGDKAQVARWGLGEDDLPDEYRKLLGEPGEISRERAVDLAARARSIAEDVNQVCGQERCIGSLSLAVIVLSEAVQAAHREAA